LVFRSFGFYLNLRIINVGSVLLATSPTASAGSATTNYWGSSAYSTYTSEWSSNYSIGAPNRWTSTTGILYLLPYISII